MEAQEGEKAMIHKCPKCGYETLWNHCPSCLGRRSRREDRVYKPRKKVSVEKKRMDAIAERIRAYTASKGKQKVDHYGIVRRAA
jgi:rRNA maturation protein Nop10